MVFQVIGGFTCFYGLYGWNWIIFALGFLIYTVGSLKAVYRSWTDSTHILLKYFDKENAFTKLKTRESTL